MLNPPQPGLQEERIGCRSSRDWEGHLATQNCAIWLWSLLFVFASVVQEELGRPWGKIGSIKHAYFQLNCSLLLGSSDSPQPSLQEERTGCRSSRD